MNLYTELLYGSSAEDLTVSRQTIAGLWGSSSPNRVLADLEPVLGGSWVVISSYKPISGDL